MIQDRLRFKLPTDPDIAGRLPPQLAPQVLDQSADGVLIADLRLPDAPIVYANPAFTGLTGYTAAETLGLNCRFLQHQDRAQPEIAVMREAIAAGQPTSVTLRNHRRDGSMFWNEVRLAPLNRTRSGKPSHYVGFQRDVTAARESAAKLNAALEAAQSASRANARLLTAINHEFRSPIGIIAGFAEVLLTAARDNLPEPRATDHLRDIHAAAHHLLELVKDTQTYIAMTEQRALPNRTQVRLLSAMQEAVRLAKHQVTTAGVKLSVQVEAEHRMISVDRALFNQALINLVCELARRAPPNASVLVRVGADGLITLHCDALVLPEGKSGEMLEPFATGNDIYVRGLEGAKINVAVAAAILRLLGGDLRVHSDAATGTRFIVALPTEPVARSPQTGAFPP